MAKAIKVFIDALEYFSGILILTTNRVGSFDDAVMSRIHLSLYYPSLDRDGTLQIWESMLGRLGDTGIEVDYDEILEFVKGMHEDQHAIWNGRKIRNAITTALSLAREDARSAGRQYVKLRPKHFKAVLASSLKFTQYQSSIYEGDGTRALTRQERLDTFRSPSPGRLESTSKGIEPMNKREHRRNFDIDVTEPDTAQGEMEDDDLEIQELEIKLEIAKLKRKQKLLNTRKIQRGQGKHNIQTSDGTEEDD